MSVDSFTDGFESPKDTDNFLISEYVDQFFTYETLYRVEESVKTILQMLSKFEESIETGELTEEDIPEIIDTMIREISFFTKHYQDICNNYNEAGEKRSVFLEEELIPKILRNVRYSMGKYSVNVESTINLEEDEFEIDTDTIIKLLIVIKELSFQEIQKINKPDSNVKLKVTRLLDAITVSVERDIEDNPGELSENDDYKNRASRLILTELTDNELVDINPDTGLIHRNISFSVTPNIERINISKQRLSIDSLLKNSFAEASHRTGNFISIIQSILKFSKYFIQEKPSQNVLQDIIKRIESMRIAFDNSEENEEGSFVIDFLNIIEETIRIHNIDTTSIIFEESMPVFETDYNGLLRISEFIRELFMFITRLKRDHNGENIQMFIKDCSVEGLNVTIKSNNGFPADVNEKITIDLLLLQQYSNQKIKSVRNTWNFLYKTQE